MTHSARPTPIPLPISALLAPQHESDSPNEALPTPLALLGPLPPTSPIHLALNHLYLSSIPTFTTSDEEVAGPSWRSKEGDRVLVITGPKEEFGNSIEVDDEDYIRDRGGDYEVLDRLRRVDLRYCPTVTHVMLLLSLLTEGKEVGPHNLGTRPTLVILWNIAGLLMEVYGTDENTDVGEGGKVEEKRRGVEPTMRFKKEVVISDYLEMIAAAKSAMGHLSSLDTKTPTSLIILEPELTPDASLPIFPPGNSAEGIPKGSREKRIKLQLGLERILGQGCFGGIIPAHVDENGGAAYTLSLAKYPNQGYSMRRRHCPRAEYGSARQEVDSDGLPAAQGDPGGWRWEWT